MTASLATVSYIGATILFILSLGGLSNPETARRGNAFGMVGMAIAVLATVLGPNVTPAGYAWIVGALVVGGGIYLYRRAKRAVGPGTRTRNRLDAAASTYRQRNR
jgi:NAD(P) transhydrogenase subunit beta